MPKEPPLTETVEPGDAAPGTPEIAPGEILAGRYEIGEILGRGGLAVVYRARDRELKRDVALKALRADRFSAASLLRLRREVKVARDVTSDRLVRIFDITTSENSVFLTMEVVEGGSLDRRLSEGPLPVDEAIRIAAQILEGLAVLHQRAIVHRDVKAGNVLLTSDGDVKLGDFGLALPLTTDETRATGHDAVVGTLQYLSPEQVLGQEVDARSDLYSLGVVLFEMLTGRHPYEGRSVLGAMLGHLRETPNVRTVRPEVPRWLGAVVQRLLARRPEDRYPSAEAVRAALAAKAIPRSWLTRAAIAALLLLVACGAAVVWLKPEPTSFSYLSYSQEGATAMSKVGRRLWTVSQVQPSNSIAAQLAPSEPRRVVAVLDAYRRRETATVLSILDADTGSELKKVELPAAAERFQGFSNTFYPRLYALDLDGDGAQEVIIVYTHSPWWPTYVVLYEPRIDRARLIFLASGHHQFKGAQDLDGDGKAELLLAGINNRMGWYTGIAAVRLVPEVNAPYPWAGTSAGSPDDNYFGAYPKALLWYCLGPRDDRLTEDPAAFDAARKTISLRYTGKSFRLGFQGFPAPLAATPTRRAARDLAYKNLRETERLLQVGFFDAALSEVAAAGANAARAGDPFLADWVARVRARSLVAAGRYEQAERAYQELTRTSEASTDAAFEAGKAFHLAGLLDRAVEWYRRGFGRGGSANAGRGKWEVLEGAVLALAELGRYRDAQTAIDDFVAAYGDQDPAEQLRRFLLWRQGEPPTLPNRNPEMVQDLYRYWELEIQLAAGGDPRSLVAKVDQSLSLTSESAPMLLALKAELLGRTGRHREAAQVAEEGYELARQQRRELTGVGAHFRLIAQRAAALSRAVGNGSRAREIEAELAEWLEKRG
jgi:serine/threonine protein kinase/tetratricopeptide (TPR) repeat protein